MHTSYYLPLILMFILTCSDPLHLMVSGYSEDMLAPVSILCRVSMMFMLFLIFCYSRGIFLCFMKLYLVFRHWPLNSNKPEFPCH